MISNFQDKDPKTLNIKEYGDSHAVINPNNYVYNSYILKHTLKMNPLQCNNKWINEWLKQQAGPSKYTLWV